MHVWNDGTRRLQSRFSGKCLDDSAAYGLRMFDCNSETFQSWYVKRWNDGTIELRNQATGKCLDHSAAYGLRTFSCNSSRFQSWF
ncbi:RICIN domain-containing protein [Streptomyces sp. NPDC054784]